MKNVASGDRRSALCHRDGRVTVTFQRDRVPFSDGSGYVEDLLVGKCDVCGDAIVIPASSTPQISQALKARHR